MTSILSLLRALTAACAVCLLVSTSDAQTSAAEQQRLRAMPGASPLGRVVDRRPGRKNVLAWIDSRSLMQSHAAAVIERMGHDSGLYDTYIRSDARAAMDVEKSGATGGLDKFDAIFFLGSRDDDLGEAQRGALLAFVRDGGGFLAGHATTDSFPEWREFGVMLGARLEQHPWGKTDTTLLVERPTFPGMERIARVLATHDETYELRDFSRNDMDVLLRMDARKMDPTKPHRQDGDFPMIWVKTYGNGRVYGNTLGHEVDAWDNPAFQRMYLEAMKWALGLTSPPLAPHAQVPVDGRPAPLK